MVYLSYILACLKLASLCWYSLSNLLLIIAASAKDIKQFKPKMNVFSEIETHPHATINPVRKTIFRRFSDILKYFLVLKVLTRNITKYPKKMERLDPINPNLGINMKLAATVTNVP